MKNSKGNTCIIVGVWLSEEPYKGVCVMYEGSYGETFLVNLPNIDFSLVPIKDDTYYHF